VQSERETNLKECYWDLKKDRDKLAKALINIHNIIVMILWVGNET